MTASRKLSSSARARSRALAVTARIGQRIVGALVMIFAVASFTFFLVRLLPGDPLDAEYETLIERGLAPDQAEAQVHRMYGFVPHDSLWNQYVSYLTQLLHLDLGQSISYQGIPVVRLISLAAPYTITLVLSGIVVSFLIGVVGGVVAAVRRNTRVGNALTISGTVLHGIPQFVLALLLAFLFTTLWPLFPFGSPYDASIEPGFSLDFIASLVSHAVLPVTAYALSSYGGWLLVMKSSVISVLGDDFILAAELRGLRQPTIMRYIGRNAMLPLFTIFAISIGFMFGGSIFIENIFNYPGLGNLLLSSVGHRDYPLMSGAFLLISAAVIVANIAADLLYTIIDPRVRT